MRNKSRTCSPLRTWLPETGRAPRKQVGMPATPRAGGERTPSPLACFPFIFFFFLVLVFMLFVHILLDSHSSSFPPCILPFVCDYSSVSSSRVSSHDLPCSFVFSVLFLVSFPLSLLQIPLFPPLSSPTKGARTEHPDPQRLTFCKSTCIHPSQSCTHMTRNALPSPSAQYAALYANRSTA